MSNNPAEREKILTFIQALSTALRRISGRVEEEPLPTLPKPLPDQDKDPNDNDSTAQQ
ncbi:MAG: hypothetical protein ABIG63_04125 [Chloroflexota bacterium]